MIRKVSVPTKEASQNLKPNIAEPWNEWTVETGPNEGKLVREEFKIEGRIWEEILSSFVWDNEVQVGEIPGVNNNQAKEEEDVLFVSEGKSNKSEVENRKRKRTVGENEKPEAQGRTVCKVNAKNIREAIQKKISTILSSKTEIGKATAMGQLNDMLNEVETYLRYSSSCLVKELQQEIRDLKYKLQESEKRYNDVDAYAKRLKLSLSVKIDELKESEASNEVLKSQNEEAEERIKQLEEENRKLKEEKEALKEQSDKAIGYLYVKADESYRRTNELQAENDALKLKISAMVDNGL